MFDVIFLSILFYCLMSATLNQAPTEAYSHQSDKHYLVEINQQKKCICELCACGKHRRPKPPIKGTFETSYNNHYKNIQIPVLPNPPKVTYQQRHYNPNLLKTKYQQTFCEKPQLDLASNLNGSRLQNIGKSTLRTHVPFNGTTSYAEQYKPFILQPMNVNPQIDNSQVLKRDRVPDYGIRPPVKFDDYTSYKAHYQTPTPPKPSKSPYQQYKKPQVPFVGYSSYKDQFKQYKIEAEKPTYQSFSNPMAGVPKVRFQGESTYKQLFKGYQFYGKQQPSGKPCPVQYMSVPPSNFLNNSPHITNSDVEATAL